MKIKFLCYSISWMCLGGLTARAQVSLNPSPSREIGHPAAAFNPLNSFPLNANPNLVEGREFFAPGGIAIDTGSNPPILWVADTGNNRVLGWNYTPSLGDPSSGAFPPADYILGQPDRYSTASGNAQTNANGLAVPYGLAIPPDGSGNLYVVDSGNNRIVRYPRGSSYPDLVIGQPNANFNLVNQGQGGTPGQNTLAFGGNPASIVFDKNGNLYVADIGNNRVLRFNASDLPPAPCSANCFGMNAALVLGQNGFSTNTPQQSKLDSSNTNLVLNGLKAPVALAVDAQNRVYVGDNLNRVLVYPANVSANGTPAQFIAGVPPLTGTAPTQAVLNNINVASAYGLFITPQGRLGVVDPIYCRIMLFPSVDTPNAWPSPATRTGPSPQASAIFPQANTDLAIVLPSHYINAGNAEASPSSLNFPTFAVVGPNGELLLSDTGNHRVLVLPAPVTSFSPATRVLGQDQFNFMSPNLIEGREFQFTFTDSNGNHGDSGIVIDQNSNPPHLYVADTYNNRILGFNDARSIKVGAQADLVLGQPDFKRSVCNYNPNSAAASQAPTASSLCQPVGLAVDSQGNLWVADRGNHRVVRYANPFAQGGFLQPANLVLPQGNTNSNASSPAGFSAAGPYGIALNNDSDLIVSDPGFNRVLIYQLQGANWVRAKVLGQADPNSCQANCPSGNALNQFRNPTHVSFDSSGIIYVADFGNNRVQIFSNPANVSNNDFAQSYSLTGLNNPTGLFINQQTGEIWVANTNSFNVLRYPNLDNIVRGSVQPAGMQENAAPLAVTQDQFGDLYVVDSSNRVVIHYPALLAVNGASQLIPSGTNRPAPLAPGVIATLCPPLRPDLAVACRPDDINQFGADSASYTDLPNPVPLPTVLADLQVLINGNPAPLFSVSPQQINFQVPMSTPTGTSLIEVVRMSTGQTLGSYPVVVNTTSPALFHTTVNTHATFTGNDPCRGTPGICYQTVATNSDGTVNGDSTFTDDGGNKHGPAAHGTTISIFGTGQGVVSGGPADGDVAGGQVPTSYTPRVLFGNGVECPVSYSGLTPGQIGQWQIDCKIPDTVQSGTFTIIVVTPDGKTSNDTGKLQTTVTVK